MIARRSRKYFNRVSIRYFLATLICVALINPTHANQNLPVVEVYKNPTCGCCDKWVKHLEQYGFQVNVVETDALKEKKASLGVPLFLDSCHTAVVGEYVIEGHVPAEDIERLLTEKPDVTGIAVPRMPIGSPGMEGPNPQPFKVLSFSESGEFEEFCAH